MVSTVLSVALGLLLTALLLQLFVQAKLRAAIDRTAKTMPTAAPVADRLPLAEIRVQLTELGFLVGSATALDERMLTMVGSRTDGVVAESADPTNPRLPARTGFLTGFEGGALLTTQQQRHVPVPEGDVAQVLPGAPIDELLAAHVRGCRLMERAGHVRVRVNDPVGAQALLLLELDHLAERLRHLSLTDRLALLRLQRSTGTEGRLLTTDEPLPPAPGPDSFSRRA